MIHLVYASSATHLMSDDELHEILRVSRINNDRDGITGILLNSGGNIMQALEGPENRVDHLMQRREQDERHHGIHVMLREPKFKRYFSEWSMGFYNTVNLPAEDARHLSPLLESQKVPATFEEDPQKAHRLLLTFKRIMV